MRIGIDAHALGTGAGGNESYVRELLHGLRERSESPDVTAFAHRGISEADTAGFPVHTLRCRSSWLRVPFELPLAAKRLGADVLHVQFNAPPVCPCPFVVSVHDFVWKRYPETLPMLDRLRLATLVPGTLRRATRVFVLTEAMKQEAMAFYDVPGEKIDVTGSAVAPAFRPVTDEAERERVRQRYGLPEHFVAYLGALQPRKNIVRLARAFARLEALGLPHALVLVGRQRWHYGKIGSQLAALDLGGRLMGTGYADSADLPTILSLADAFAYVPIYEGFGIPVAEALACATPVLTSAGTACEEVAGDAAVCVKPFDVDAIEDGLVRVLTDTDLRRTLSGRGPLRAARFNRVNMAAAAMAGYKKAVE